MKPSPSKIYNLYDILDWFKENYPEFSEKEIKNVISTRPNNGQACCVTSYPFDDEPEEWETFVQYKPTEAKIFQILLKEFGPEDFYVHYWW